VATGIDMGYKPGIDMGNTGATLRMLRRNGIALEAAERSEPEQGGLQGDAREYAFCLFPP